MATVETKINGIDTDALKQAMGEISTDAAKGIAKFQVATRWQGGTRSETSVNEWALGGTRLPRDFTIAADEPQELLGDATAPNPQEILMSGLNACILVGYPGTSCIDQGGFANARTTGYDSYSALAKEHVADAFDRGVNLIVWGEKRVITVCRKRPSLQAEMLYIHGVGQASG